VVKSSRVVSVEVVVIATSSYRVMLARFSMSLARNDEFRRRRSAMAGCRRFVTMVGGNLLGGMQILMSINTFSML
jgi:hypothetical protein